MSKVRLRVAGKDYVIACASGEETHIAQLGQTLDAKIQSLGEGVTTDEPQRLLFGALFLADELDELQKISAADKQRFEAEKADLEDQSHATKAARDQHDQMTTRIADLESQLADLQSAHKQQANDSDTMRAELQQSRADMKQLLSDKDATDAQKSQLTRECDTLLRQIEAKDILLESANTLIDEINAKVAKASTEAVQTAAMDNPQTSPDLALALDRFAELLETCADKLEAQLPSG